MSLTGKNTLSLRKKDVNEQRSIAVGFKKLVFAHKASLGATGIDLGSLVTPTEMSSLGFVNASTADMLAAKLLFFNKNLTLTSSSRNLLMQDLSYTVKSNSRIEFQGFTALEGEIFVGVIDASARTGNNLVDARPIVATGSLAISVTDFNVGTPFRVNHTPGSQVGEVVVYRNGMQQFRNVGNSPTGDGNYYEVQAGNGLGTVIRFNSAPVSQADNIMVISNGLIAERPDGSMMAVIESLAGQLDQVIPTVAALAGQPETNFQAAPNNVDLKQFGDTVIAMLSTQIPIITDWISYVPNFTGFGTVSSVSYQWRRVGENIEIQGTFVSGTPTATQGQVSLPTDLLTSSTIVSTSNHYGTWFRQISGGTTNKGGALLLTSSQNYFVFGPHTSFGDAGATDSLTNQLGNALVGTGNTVSTSIKFPISGWTSTQTLKAAAGL